MKQKKHTKGFTLLELAVVVGVAGMLLALATPSFLSMLRSTRLTTVTNQYIATLMFARSEAVKRALDVTVDFNIDGHPLVVRLAECQLEDCWIRAMDKLPPEYVSTLHTENANVTYQSSGMMTPSGYLQICTPYLTRVIILPFTGHLHLAKDRDNNGLPEVFDVVNNVFKDVSPCP